MVLSLIKNIFGFEAKNKKKLSKLEDILTPIKYYEEEFSKLEDDQLRKKTDEFKKKLESNKKNNQVTLDSILPEAFAVVREACRRTPALGMVPYDIQIMGAAVLHGLPNAKDEKGKLLEMGTGEGKTLVAATTVYLNALEGKGVHIATFNDYLAERDSAWMKPLFDFLGLSVGCIKENMNEKNRKEQYLCDITYASTKKLIFDSLRDNLKNPDEKVQREFNFAIIDEVDAQLIDEARTPFIISKETNQNISKEVLFAAELAEELNLNIDYENKQEDKTINLTEKGYENIEIAIKNKLNINGNLSSATNTEFIFYRNAVLTALKAKEFFKNGKDYEIKDSKICIVDEFTGRILEGRKWSHGLHEAIEAKENKKGIFITNPSEKTAETTIYHFFNTKYKKFTGMSGSVATSAEELYKNYNLDTIILKTHHPNIRVDFKDVYCETKDEKIEKVILDAIEKHNLGRPILLCTKTIEDSEHIYNKLKNILREDHVQYLNLLNGRNKFAKTESEIIKEAGNPYMITIATNMAGRGTDIKIDSTVKKEVLANLKKTAKNLLKTNDNLIIHTHSTGKTKTLINNLNDCITDYKNLLFEFNIPPINCDIMDEYKQKFPNMDWTFDNDGFYEIMESIDTKKQEIKESYNKLRKLKDEEQVSLINKNDSNNLMVLNKTVGSYRNVLEEQFEFYFNLEKETKIVFETLENKNYKLLGKHILQNHEMLFENKDTLDKILKEKGISTNERKKIN